MIETYQPSGRCGAMTYPLVFAGLIVAAALGWVYQLAVHWIPLIYVNLLITIAYAAALFFVVGMLMKVGQCRSPMIGALMGAVIGVVGVAATHYQGYQLIRADLIDAGLEMVDESERDEAREFFEKEFTFGKYMELRVEEGWSLGRATSSSEGGLSISGIFVYLIWLIEGGIIVLGGLIGGNAQAAAPYLEAVEKWADEEDEIYRVYVGSKEPVEAVQQAQTIEELIRRPIGTARQSNTTLVYKLNRAAGHDDQQAFLTIALNVETEDKKGESKTDTTEIWSNVVLTPDQTRTLLTSAVAPEPIIPPV